MFDRGDMERLCRELVEDGKMQYVDGLVRLTERGLDWGLVLLGKMELKDQIVVQMVCEEVFGCVRRAGEN